VTAGRRAAWAFWQSWSGESAVRPLVDRTELGSRSRIKSDAVRQLAWLWVCRRRHYLMRSHVQLPHARSRQTVLCAFFLIPYSIPFWAVPHTKACQQAGSRLRNAGHSSAPSQRLSKTRPAKTTWYRGQSHPVQKTTPSLGPRPKSCCSCFFGKVNTMLVRTLQALVLGLVSQQQRRTSSYHGRRGHYIWCTAVMPQVRV
jgi:hypothetical protein